MFYEYIYLDSEKIKQFSLNLGINFFDVVEDSKREKGIKAKVAAGIVSTEFEAKEEQNYKNQQSEIQIFTKFKDRLEKVDNGSFVNSNHYRELEYINQLERGKILKFDSTLRIPEQFGEIDFIKNVIENDTLKDVLMDEINIGQDKEKAIFSLFFGKNKETKIPVYFEIGEYKLYSLLDRKYLNISDFADFENLQNEELTIYTKIEKVDNSNNEVEIVDLFKDVLGLNRAMRRNINSNNNSNNNSTANFSDKIVLNGKTIKSSIIALLK